MPPSPILGVPGTGSPALRSTAMDLETFQKAFTGQPITAADVIVALVVLGGGVLLSWLLGRALRSALGRPGGPNEQMEKLIGRVVHGVSSPLPLRGR